MSAHISMVNEEPNTQERPPQNYSREIHIEAVGLNFAHSGGEALELLDNDDAHNLGPAQFLTKPVDFVALKEPVANLVSQAMQ